MKLDISSIKNRVKMNSIITGIKNKVHEETFHTKAIPYHKIPFHDQVKETHNVLLELGVEIKTRQKALARFSEELENARGAIKGNGTGAKGREEQGTADKKAGRGQEKT